MEAADKAIGPAAALRVNPGDRVELETWVRYRKETDYTHGIPVFMLSQLLGSTFEGTGGFEGYTPAETSGYFETALGNGGFGSDASEDTTPFAYLNFIVFDENTQMVDAGFQRVRLEAGFNAGEEALRDMHRKVPRWPVEKARNRNAGSLYCFKELLNPKVENRCARSHSVA